MRNFGFCSDCVLQLQEVVQNGLEGNEYVSILSWIMNTYAGPELMQHPELNIDTSSVGPLLNNAVVSSLQQQYLKVGSCPGQTQVGTVPQKTLPAGGLLYLGLLFISVVACTEGLQTLWYQSALDDD
jgi:hypothetical protein